MSLMTVGSICTGRRAVLVSEGGPVVAREGGSDG